MFGLSTICIIIALVWIIEDNFQMQAPGSFYSEGLIIGGIFAFQIWGASIRRGLFSEFYGIYFALPTLTMLCEGGVSEQFSMTKGVFFGPTVNFCVYCVYYSANVTDLREETKALPSVTMKGTLRPLLRKTHVDLPRRAESLNGHVNWR